MDIVMRKVADLVPYEKNAKMHNETQIKNVAESIKQFGWRQPIVVDKNDVIVMGHCRALAAQELGIEEVPVTIADDLTDEQIRKLRLIDNKSAESIWDVDLLRDELDDLDLTDFDFEWGVSDLVDPEPPEEFKEFDEDIEAKCKCPKCGYEW